MYVFLLKDIERVGLASNIIKVSDGYAKNYLLPRNLVVEITDKNRAFYEGKANKKKVTTKILNNKIAMLGEHIKSLHLTVKKKTHDDGKLYGSVGADDIVVALRAKDININKKQVEFIKTVKTVGSH